VLLSHGKLQSASNLLMSWRALLLALNVADVVSAAAAITGGIMTLVSIDDHRERLKLIWSFSEAADSMVGRDGI